MNYLQLNEIIFIQPFSSIIAVIIVMSIISTGHNLGRKILGLDNTESLIIGYVIIIISLSVIVNILITFHINNILFIRVFIIILIIYGIFNIIISRSLVHNLLKRFTNYFIELCIFEKLIFSLVFFNMLALFLNSLTPPTDADSLDYHLGVPLFWLQYLDSYPLKGWLHTRLIGLGEIINYIGLVFGTDILGQVVQYSGLWIVYLSLFILMKKNTHLLITGLLVFTIPLNIYLVTSQKPFLFPSAVMFFGFTIFLKNTINLTAKIYLISLLFICYGIACKYSFIIAGFIFIIFIMLTSIKKNMFPLFVMTCFISVLIILVPIYLRNYIYFGDPLSPILEFTKSDPDSLILRFAKSIRSYGGEINIFNVLLLPITLGITFNITLISTVLGVGTLTILFIKIKNSEAKTMLFLSLAICGTVLLIGNISPRYYLEAYWLLIGVLCYNEVNKRIFIFRKILLFQAILFTLISTYGVVSLFPGSVSANFRDKVMAKSADGYNESKWLDGKLSSNSYILAQVRSNALLPRRYVPWDRFFWGKGQEDINKYLKSNKSNGITALFLRLPLHKDLYWLNQYSNSSLKQTFYKGTRNPFNRGDPYEMQLFIISE